MRQAISPRLAMRTFLIMTPSHAEHAEACFLDRRVERGGEAERQNLAGLGGMDDAVVPKPRRGIKRMALFLELIKDRKG